MCNFHWHNTFKGNILYLMSRSPPLSRLWSCCMVALTFYCVTGVIGCCGIYLDPRATTCAQDFFMWILQTETCFYFSLFPFCIDIRFSIRFSSPSDDGVYRHPETWKNYWDDLRGIFYFAESNSVWLISIYVLFLQNYCKGFLFHSLQHSVFHIWIDRINMNSL